MRSGNLLVVVLVALTCSSAAIINVPERSVIQAPTLATKCEDGHIPDLLDECREVWKRHER